MADLPIANISRIMKNALPDNAKIAKDAKECVQECVTEFIAFITSEGLLSPRVTVTVCCNLLFSYTPLDELLHPSLVDALYRVAGWVCVVYWGLVVVCLFVAAARSEMDGGVCITY